jgi:hypothetical protein
MNHRHLLSLPIVAVAWVSGAPALADDVHCPPHLGPVVVDGNVLIVAACRLEGTTVKGNVHLYSGGSLIAVDAKINGNIQAERADFIDVTSTAVGGSVQLDEMVGDLSRVELATIGGSIQLKSNRSRLEVLDSEIGADVQAFSNSGGVLVAGNTIDGNLQCKSNEPQPVGGNNRVHGNKEDQCANLQPEALAGASRSAAEAPTAVADGAAVAAAAGETGRRSRGGCSRDGVTVRRFN